MTKILIKRLSNQVSLPQYETDGASGMDLGAFTDKIIKIKSNEKAIIPTGLSVAIPKGFELQIRPRSGLAVKNSLTILNTPGTIDSDYRGEIKVIIFNLGKKTFEVTNGLRIAQMVLCPIAKVNFEEVKNLNETARGEGGFGSTGTK
jgi:dUTP pyrophosphatase|tara:strand:- start:739 stop:1179 length:441 start_codon:yes stop_codon:yes gene_type:complete